MTRFLAATRVDSSNVLRCLVGRFHKSCDSAILWGYSDRVELYHEEPHGGLLLFHKQHTHDKLLELGFLHGQPDGLENDPQDLDMPVLLFASHRVAVLRFEHELQRFTTIHAICLRSYGIPTLCNQSMLHVDPESWTIALSPDRAALVVFIRGQDHSLSSLLSAPVRVSVSTPQEHLSMHEQNERTWIDAMTFADVPAGQGMSKRYLCVLTQTHKITVVEKNANFPDLEQGAEPVPGEIHRVLAFSVEGSIHLEGFEDVHASSIAGARSSTPKDASVSKHQLLCCGQEAGVLYFQPGEVQKITPIPCKAGPAPGDMERQGSLRLVVERYPLRMTGPETPQQPLDNLTSLWQQPGEMDAPPTAVCSAAGVNLLWTMYGLHRLSFSGDKLLMTKIMPQGAVDGQPCPSWLQCPGRMTGLPSGAVLMVSEGHGARIVAGAAEGGPRVAQVINLVSQLASAFTTDRSRLCQKQVVGLSPGLSRTDEPTPGQLHVLHASRVVDCLYESPPDYAGVTGLFPVSLTSQDDATAALVISFASGSRALTAGDTFSDITESVGLDAEAQTLTAATISPGCMAQVTLSIIRLCPLHALRPSGSGEMETEGTPRKRLSSMPGDNSGCGMEHSMAGTGCTSEQDASETSSSRGGSALLSRPSYEAQSRSCSSWDGLPAGEETATWQPPGNASITCAVVLPGLVLVASAQPNALTALVLSHPGSPYGRGAGAGKRKRLGSLPQLVSAASTGLPAEASCVHAIKRHEGTHGSSFFCLAGLHGAVLALYMLQGDSHDGRQWSLQQLCSIQAPPSRFCHSWEGVSEVEDVPGSMLLLAGASAAHAAHSVQALVGWRSGQVMQVECTGAALGGAEAVDETAGRMSSMLQLSSPGGSAVREQQQDMEMDTNPVTGLRVVCVRRMGSLPVQLTSLRSLAPALCISEHIALGSFSLGSGRLMLEPLACHSILHAAPLLCGPDVAAAPNGGRWRLLTASEDGTLRLLQLARGSPVQVQTAELPPNCELVALSEPFHRLGVVHSATLHQPAMLECLDLDHLLMSSSATMSGTEPGFQGEGMHAPSCSLPIVPGSQSKATCKALCIAALTGPAFCDPGLEWYASYAVGGQFNRVAPRLGWLQVVCFGSHSWEPSLRFSNYFEGQVTAVTQYRRDHCVQDLLMASIGSRLVCLGPERQQISAQQSAELSTCDWTRTREPLSAISISPGSGLVATVGPSQSAVIYSYSSDRGFEVLCADPVCHNPVACLPLNRSAEDAQREFLLLDHSGLLLKLNFQEHERQIECNMQAAACFHTRTPCVSLCYGSMRREDLGMPEGLGSRCMTACARDGSVTEVVPVPEEDWCVLAAAQGALCRHRLTAPLSWAEHGRFRHRAGLATQATTDILDGNVLAQLEHLPHAVAQQVLRDVDRADIAKLVTKDGHQAVDAVLAGCSSVESVLQILDRTLTVLWPPP